MNAIRLTLTTLALGTVCSIASAQSYYFPAQTGNSNPSAVCGPNGCTLNRNPQGTGTGTYMTPNSITTSPHFTPGSRPTVPGTTYPQGTNNMPRRPGDNLQPNGPTQPYGASPYFGQDGFNHGVPTPPNYGVPAQPNWNRNRDGAPQPLGNPLYTNSTPNWSNNWPFAGSTPNSSGLNLH